MWRRVWALEIGDADGRPWSAAGGSAQESAPRRARCIPRGARALVEPSASMGGGPGPARDARRRLALSCLARAPVLLGHDVDDQAEPCCCTRAQVDPSSRVPIRDGWRGDVAAPAAGSAPRRHGGCLRAGGPPASRDPTNAIDGLACRRWRCPASQLCVIARSLPGLGLGVDPVPASPARPPGSRGRRRRPGDGRVASLAVSCEASPAASGREFSPW